MSKSFCRKHFPFLACFFSYYKKYRSQLIILQVFMVLGSSLGVLLSYFQGRQVIAISELESTTMLWYTGCVITVVSLHHTFCFLWDKFSAKIGNHIANDIRQDLLASILNTQLGVVRKQSTGYYLERIKGEVYDTCNFS